MSDDRSASAVSAVAFSAPTWRRSVVAALGACIAAFVGIYLNVRDPMWDLNREHNLPTYFNALLLALAGLAAVRHARWTARAGQSPWPVWLLAAALLFAAADEALVIHEQMTAWARASTGVERLKDIWMFVYVPVLGAGFWLLRPWWRRLRVEAPRSAWAIVAALACWFFAFASEAVEIGVQFEVISKAWRRPFVGIEEGLEMLGALLMFYALLAVPTHRESAPIRSEPS